jgi:MFS family permease
LPCADALLRSQSLCDLLFSVADARYATLKTARLNWEEKMDSKTYLTICAIVLLLYGIGFAATPAEIGGLYGVPTEPYVQLAQRFFGSALLGLGVTNWFARDLTDRIGVRAVLFGGIVGYGISALLLIWYTFQGLLNQLAWGSTILNILLVIWALYLLSASATRKLA